ncbi:hypothetical protein ACN47E_008558 [Coniothyrium glycines]
MDHGNERANTNFKLPIPRLTRTANLNHGGSRNNRANVQPSISKACVQCRKRKTRCSGHLPRCIGCQKADLTCRYEPTRRDRLKEALDRNQALQTLLNDVSPQLDRRSQQIVESALKAGNNCTYSSSPSLLSISGSEKSMTKFAITGWESSHQNSEQFWSSSAVNDTTFMTENLLAYNDGSSCGFMGRSSHAHWLHMIHKASGLSKQGEGHSYMASAQPAETVTDEPSVTIPEPEPKPSNEDLSLNFSYYLDDTDIETEDVECDAVPPFETAQRLWDIYERAANNIFRILDSTYHYLRKMEGYTKSDEHDHRVYLWRAIHLLNLKRVTMCVFGGDLLLIRALGLLSFCYLITGHVSKAWNTIGISLRHAEAAGMHAVLEHASKHEHYSQILQNTCEQRNYTIPSTSTKPFYASTPRFHTYTFIEASTKINILLSTILSRLFSTRITSRSSSWLRSEISSLNHRLETWARMSFAPEILEMKPMVTSQSSRQDVLLYLDYNIAKIYISQPCLCILHQEIVDTNTQKYSAWIQQEATECVQAALNVTAVLPDHPNVRWLYEKGPWWSGVHAIMQAMIVLLPTSSKQTIRTKADEAHIDVCVDKLTNWLRHLSSKDGVAERAYKLSIRISKGHDFGEFTRTTVQATPPPIPFAVGAHTAQPSELGLHPYLPLLPTEQVQSSAHDIPFASGRMIPNIQSPSSYALFHNDFYSSANDGNFDLYPESNYYTWPKSSSQTAATYSPYYDNAFGLFQEEVPEVEWDQTILASWPGPST